MRNVLCSACSAHDCLTPSLLCCDQPGCWRAPASDSSPKIEGSPTQVSPLSTWRRENLHERDQHEVRFGALFKGAGRPTGGAVNAATATALLQLLG